MALIEFTDHSRKFISAEQGVALWRVMSGEVKPTPKQRAFIKRISRLYLNHRTAPESYKRKYAELIDSMANKPVRLRELQQQGIKYWNEKD